ncbi:hypothetical protein UFOVP181_428 [uncultured Caudovirales phage]|uniref:Uncharacterized protein n=1 Tax=uncultured Caudovirales phage TaxID=2100421 RepID=A0A6J7WEP1_9CAUD|nr:hypothetical protein UFOVP57_211 [uncultured Caudovirales phage]CAB5209331.1 hypothetical protein UFOVP181_428 [uncultured Caudovirales phage]
MSTLAEQIRALADRLQAIQEGEGQPPQTQADFQRQMDFIKKNGSGYIPPKDNELASKYPEYSAPKQGELPRVASTSQPGLFALRTQDELIWIYANKKDPACTEPVAATYNGKPVTVMKLPGVTSDHESRGWIKV